MLRKEIYRSIIFNKNDTDSVNPISFYQLMFFGKGNIRIEIKLKSHTLETFIYKITLSNLSAVN